MTTLNWGGASSLGYIGDTYNYTSAYSTATTIPNDYLTINTSASSAMTTSTSGAIAIGYSAASAAPAIAIGRAAVNYPTNTVAIGYNAGAHHIQGNNSVFIGANSGQGVTKASNNVYLGSKKSRTLVGTDQLEKDRELGLVIEDDMIDVVASLRQQQRFMRMYYLEKGQNKTPLYDDVWGEVVEYLG
jgi:hypothetical protein